MNRVLHIAGAEVLHLARSKVALTGLALVALLTLAAVVTSSAHARDQAALRTRLQAQADSDFASQPNRHPHRVVHFGHFAVRPATGLAALDPGVDAFTGDMVFLEGHRQNSANFGDARQSSLLVRFGQFSPAFILQAIAPLLIIFLGAGMITRERESGALRQLILSGARGGDVLGGKMLALGGAATIIALPAAAFLGWLTVQGQATAAGAGWFAAGYGAYLAFWVVLTVTVSALAPRGRSALIALVAIWAATVILAPRISPEFATAAAPLPTRLETDVAVQRDLRAMGDSHDPDDPYFDAFKRKTLASYGVARIEDLPVNYKGLLAIEGERMTSSLFDRYADQAFAAMARQSATMDAFGLLSPTVALRRLSMTAAQTDLSAYQRFLKQAESYRYALIQRLNRLQAEAVDYADDTAKGEDSASEARSRIAADHWRNMPTFSFVGATERETAHAALAPLIILTVWLILAGALAWLCAKRLERNAR